MHKVVLIILFLSFQVSFSQNTEDIRKLYTINNWTTDNGLPQNSINDIYQSEDGYIWILTFAGIAKFDGIKFTNINSSNTPGITADRLITFIPINKNDFLILEENGKIIIYENNKFHTFNSAKDFTSDWLYNKYAGLLASIKDYAVFLQIWGLK